MARPINLCDYERLAPERLPALVYDYYAGGANDELTLAENLQAWGRWHLRPRILVDVADIDPRTTVLGHPLAMPVLTAPCAFNALAHPEGECAVARAAASAGIIQIVSTLSTQSLEEVAMAANGQRWFQLYCYRDRGVTRALVERAEAAGYTALCLTVDVPVAGQRERDIRNGFGLPAGMRCKNLTPVGLDQIELVADDSALQRYINELLDRHLTWESVLPEVVETVAQRAEVLVDGGIRRGTDVLKALALGARAVLIGRPYLWGLAVEGEAGVRHVLELLHQEIVLAMALVGRPVVSAIDRTLLA